MLNEINMAILENMVRRECLGQVLDGLSAICGEKASVYDSDENGRPWDRMERKLGKLARNCPI